MDFICHPASIKISKYLSFFKFCVKLIVTLVAIYLYTVFIRLSAQPRISAHLE